MTFNLDANGITTVTAMDKVTKKEKVVKIENKSGKLSKEDIERMVEDAERFKEQDMKFWGGSFVSNPFGRVMFQASHDQEGVHVEKIDLSKTDFYRTHWPFLRDRRIDSYKPITKRYIDGE